MCVRQLVADLQQVCKHRVRSNILSILRLMLGKLEFEQAENSCLQLRIICMLEKMRIQRIAMFDRRCFGKRNLLVSVCRSLDMADLLAQTAKTALLATQGTAKQRVDMIVALSLQGKSKEEIEGLLALLL